MTLAEIKAQIMFQTNNDEEDIDDYLPHVVDYINDGYDRLVKVWTKNHAPQEEYPWLSADTDTPNLPDLACLPEREPAEAEPGQGVLRKLHDDPFSDLRRRRTERH